MSNYGRNFEFRVRPQGEALGSRFCAPSAALTGGTGSASLIVGGLPIGVPVVADLAAGLDLGGRQRVKLATAGALVTAAMPAGILLYEYAPAAYAGYDPYLTTYSDLSVVPIGAPAIVVAGDPACRILLRNTSTYSFLGMRSYAGRTMVNGLGATPTVAVGDFLVPGAGDDTDGYWQSTVTAAGAWAVIESVDSTRGEVVARLLF